MNIRYSERFLRSFGDAPTATQKAFKKQAQFLLQNLQHPSLRAKKYDEANDIWQARVTRDWFPYHERGMAQGGIWMSARLGGALAPLAIGLLTGLYPV